MKTFKYIVLGVILLSLVFSSFYFQPSVKRFRQEGTVTFCETYSLDEVIAKLGSDDRLFTWLHMENTNPGSSRIGTCNKDDLHRIWEYARSESFRSKAQKDLVIAAGTDAINQMIPLYAIRKSASDESFPLQQDMEDVRINKDPSGDTYSLLISFSRTGADKWAAMTRLNKGRDIAILCNGKVLTAPRVTEEIKGGKCSISGNFNEHEINELKATLEN